MYSEISEVLNSVSREWAFVSSMGEVYTTATTLEVRTLGKALRILKAVINDCDVGNIIIATNLYIYRITFNVFIFVFGTIPKDEIKTKFITITNNYKNFLEKSGKIKENGGKKKEKFKGKVPINLILFSMALEEGPTPVYCLPENYDKEKLLKVSMKGLLLLSVESDGAKKDMVSFQPYIDLDSLGIVYVYQIEDKNARGGAYDSALTILVDYKYRAIVYENYNDIERILNETKKKVIYEFYSGKDYKNPLKYLEQHLAILDFTTIREEDIRSEMMQTIKELAKL